MRILVLTSRYTATRDIIGEDFGRQTRLFSALKKLDYGIDFFVADYRKHESRNLKLNRINVMIRNFGIFSFLNFVMELNYTLKNNKYDFVIASSDPLWGIIGYLVSKRCNVRFAYDLHDNYETYATYKLPFFKYADNFVLRMSDIVTTVSHALKDKIRRIRHKKVFVVQNGVDLSIFKPMNKKECRKRLNLPLDAKIIAYAGSIQLLQGINVLTDAFEHLRAEIRNLRLVVAGRFVKGEEKNIDLKKNGIIYLGSLAQKDVARLINAADVAIVPNPKNDFTKYCFPYKVVEYMACNAKIVVTDVGDVGLLLKNYKNSLCGENDAMDMAAKIKSQLSAKTPDYRKLAAKNSWDSIAKSFDKILRSQK